MTAGIGPRGNEVLLASNKLFELKEYALAEQDARHNLSILDLCYQYAEAEEDRQMAEQHTPFVSPRTHPNSDSRPLAFGWRRA